MKSPLLAALLFLALATLFSKAAACSAPTTQDDAHAHVLPGVAAELSAYKYGQCQAITKSTGKRCTRGVSAPGDRFCYQHKTAHGATDQPHPPHPPSPSPPPPPPPPPPSRSAPQLASGNTVYFSPQGGATDAIVACLDTARSTVRVLAYSFTSERIAAALIAAHRRGEDVQVIVDKSQRRATGSRVHAVSSAGVPVFIDFAHAPTPSNITKSLW
jgi:phosphatidylserine/phosphatidylglycerophosphate/cardiolipin synthase-like enzyme